MTPDDCKRCTRRYNDVEEGHLCRKYGSVLTFSNGKQMEWPGAPVSYAHSNRCHGDGREPSRFALLRFWLGM